jgi:hypothetical protein
MHVYFAGFSFSLSHCVFFLCSAFAGQFEFDPQTAPARLFTFSIAFWALLMGAAYTGKCNEIVFYILRNAWSFWFEYT